MFTLSVPTNKCWICRSSWYRSVAEGRRDGSSLMQLKISGLAGCLGSKRAMSPRRLTSSEVGTRRPPTITISLGCGAEKEKRWREHQRLRDYAKQNCTFLSLLHCFNKNSNNNKNKLLLTSYIDWLQLYFSNTSITLCCCDNPHWYTPAMRWIVLVQFSAQLYIMCAVLGAEMQ